MEEELRLESYGLQGLSLGGGEVSGEHAVTRLLGELSQEVCQVSLGTNTVQGNSCYYSVRKTHYAKTMLENQVTIIHQLCKLHALSLKTNPTRLAPFPPKAPCIIGAS